MAVAKDILSIPTTFTWNANFENEKLIVRWLCPMEFMHSCNETNTYVFSPNSAIKDDDEILWDLHQIEGTALPYGQIVFLSYHSDGVFYLEAATDKFKPHLVEEAFRTFGYTDPKLVVDCLSVSTKDRFRLKLRYT